MSLALIVWLTSSGRPMIAQEPTQNAASNAPQWPQVAANLPDVVPTPSALVGPRLADFQRRSLPVQEFMGIAQPAQRGSSRDSLKNGAIIGAVVGAVGLGAFGALICNLYQEEGGASCLPDTLRVAAIGAAVGIGAGVAVDAALTRNAGVAVRIGVKF